MTLILFLIKNPKLLILIILIILLILSIYFLINYRIRSVDYKIYYLRLNMFLLLLYILVFFFAIIYTRYIRFGFVLDLKLSYAKIFDLIQSIHLFYTIIMFLLLINFILLFNLFKILLIKALIKRYIYYYFKVIYRYVLTNPEIKSSNLLKNHIFTRIIDNLKNSLSYKNIISDYVYNTFLYPYHILTDSTTYSKRVEYLLILFFSNLHRIIFIIILISDCLNNFVLQWIFYYLPFFFFIQTYKNITEFLSNTNDGLNQIIYERYYEEENILYVNTTTEEDLIILNYINNKLQDIPSNIQNGEKMFYFTFIFKKNRRFIKTKTPYIYENAKGEQIDSRENVIIETYK